MKDEKKITRVQFHVGQPVANQVCNHVSVKKHGVEMTLTELGVYITGTNTDLLVPFSNIQHVDFRTEEAK